MRHSSQRSSLIITEQRRMNMSKLTYIRCGDYDIPNLNSHARTLGTTINETMQTIGY